MPNRTGSKSKKPDRGLDSVQNARRVVLESVGEYEEVTITRTLLSQVMASMGRKGGKTGGKSRMALLTPEQRSEMGKAAAAKRWGTKKKAAK
jgi:hypothetical protein